MTRRRLAPLVVALLSAVVLTGCVNIPESSQVQEGRQIGEQDEPQHVTNEPAGPRPGASPGEIVQGYFDAMLAYPQTAAIAREFLTVQAAGVWDPAAGVVVYSEQHGSELSGIVSVTLEQVGQLDVRGAWVPIAPDNATISHEFDLTQVDGEWRITNPPPGTYIDTGYFESNYQAFSLYYFDPSRSILAPDPVYLVDDDTAATALVRDLLLGPPPSLRGAVATVAPRETKVDVSVSTSNSGLAEVPLTDEILTVSGDNLKLFAAQLAWTLRQLPEINSIAIMVDGSRVYVPGFGTVFGVDEFQGYDPAGFSADRSLYGLNKTGLVSLTSDGASTVARFSSATAGARAVRVNPSGSLAAFISADGTSVTVSDLSAQTDQTAETWFDGAESLLRPSFDVDNVLWLVDQTVTGSVLRVATVNRNNAIDIPGLGNWRITSFAVSRDGVRLAAVVRDGDETRVELWVIMRDPNHPLSLKLGAPTVIAGPTHLIDLSAVSWASPTSVVVLGREALGNTLPYELTIDSSSTVLAGQFLGSTPLALASAPNIVPLAVGIVRGRVLYETPDLQWVPIGDSKPVTSIGYGG